MRFGLPFCLMVLPQATACMQKGEGETMIMVTVQKSSWRRFFAMLGCAVALSGVFLGVNSLADGARAAEAAASGNTVKSAEDMANFLLGYGVEADVSTAQVLQVTIPKKFDESFKAFNEVIQECGMDLTRHKGKLVEKWVLQSPNRTVEDQTAYAVLLVRNAKVIGGYLLYQPSGEVLSLKQTLDKATLLPQADPNAVPVQADPVEVVPDECAAENVAAQDPTGDAAVEGPEQTPAAETAAEAENEAADIYPIE